MPPSPRVSLCGNCKRKETMKKIALLLAIVLVIIFTISCFCACQNETSEYVSFVMKMGKSGTFKILQLTDIHFNNSDVTNDKDLSKDYSLRDGWAMTAVTEIVKEADPDLIMVSGDSIFTLDLISLFTETNDNYAAFQKFAKFIDSFKIPWLFVFGNHDEEGSLHTRIGSVDGTKKVLGAYLNSDEIKYCLYDDGPEEINGVGNYILNVLNRDGSVNHSLVMFDSGSYLRVTDERTGKMYSDQRKYEYVHDDQLDWYEAALDDISRIENKKNPKSNEKVPSIVFQHIPFPEYGTVVESYIEALTELGENWEDTINPNGKERTLSTSAGEITYHGGMYGDGEVCSSFVGTFMNRKFTGGNEFERLLAYGSTKYVFCGHDHRNTFSFTYKGIRLTYGMSIDYSANGIVPPPVENQTIYDETPQRGGTLITLGEDRSVTIKQIPFTRNLYREALEARGK